MSETMKVVPREPTSEMERAMEACDRGSPQFLGISTATYNDLWRAGWDAAAPAAEPVAQQPEAPTLADDIVARIRARIAAHKRPHMAEGPNCTFCRHSELFEESAARIGSDAERIRELEAENVCDACVGTGEPISGLPCMCGGSGRMSDAARYLREQLAASRERERVAYERAAKVCSDHEDRWAESKRGYLTEYEQGHVNAAIQLASAIRELAAPDSAASPTGGRSC